MKWLLDFFFCRSWKEFFVVMLVGSVLLLALWGLVVALFILF